MVDGKGQSDMQSIIKYGVSARQARTSAVSGQHRLVATDSVHHAPGWPIHGARSIAGLFPTLW